MNTKPSEQTVSQHNDQRRRRRKIKPDESSKIIIKLFIKEKLLTTYHWFLSTWIGISQTHNAIYLCELNSKTKTKQFCQKLVKIIEKKNWLKIDAKIFKCFNCKLKQPKKFHWNYKNYEEKSSVFHVKLDNWRLMPEGNGTNELNFE